MASPFRETSWRWASAPARPGVLFFYPSPDILRVVVTVWVMCVGRFPLLHDHRLSLVLSPGSFRMGFEPLSEASLRTLWLPARFLVVLIAAASRGSSRLAPVCFPFRGQTPVSLMFLSLGPHRSLSPIPSLAPLLRRALLTLSCCVLRVTSTFLCIDLVYRSCLHCRPSRAVSSLMVSVLCAWLLLRQGRLPVRWVLSEPVGFAVAPPILPYTGPGRSPRSCRQHLGAQVSVYCFYLRNFPQVFMAIVYSV